jgi:SecD/SecF fusion protein
MQTKGFILTIASALVLICIFYLSFSFVANKYENQAIQAAIQANGGVKDEGSQKYKNAYNDTISKIEKLTVWPWKNAKYGYIFKDVREKQLGLGLDLKGGMNVTLEIKVPNVLKSLAGIQKEGQDKNFDKILNEIPEETDNYVAEFCKRYNATGSNVKSLFAKRVQKIKDKPQATDQEVQKFIEEEVDKIIDNSYKVLRTRIDRFGVIAPNIQQLAKKGRILLELPGIKDPDRVIDLLKKAANLEFYETYQYNKIAPALNELSNKYASSSAADSTVANKTLMAMLGGVSPEWCIAGYVHVADTSAVNKIINSELASQILPADLKLSWTVKAEKGKEGDPERFALVALKTDNEGNPALTGEVVTSATTSYENLKGSTVSMTMNDEGARRWARITADNINKPVAIILDDQVYSYPRVNQEITGGRSEITGDFTPEEATDLANVLESGKMDAQPEIISQRVIGPSLGQESINKGLTSFIVALVLLMIFMVCVYGLKAGSIANLGLIFNLFFTAGILASFQTVLTLPGIAGIVLALGMAVDANVLIFERIKEELRAGKGLKAAVTDGYGNAFSAIFDSNLTTIITMIILAFLGTGPIKGFAITTIVGICCSFFTAVYLTRIILEWLIKKKWFGYDTIKFSTPWTRHLMENVNFDFMGKRKLSTTIVGIIILVVIAMFFIPGRGLNRGIDFSGGRNYIVQFDQAVDVETLKDKMKDKLPQSSTSIITINNDRTVRVSTNFKNGEEFDTKKVDDEIEKVLYDNLKDSFKGKISQEEFSTANDQTGIIDIEHVGPSIAKDMTRSAVWAVFFALIAMALYILLRFRNVAFSVGALAAVAFTAFMVIGVYTLHGLLPFAMEIDQTFIAAILTVIGYQVNDTVVVFDRVREYRKLYPKEDLNITFNKALNSTLARTTMTSITTLLVLLVIFFLGGDSIRSFIFAMILGVIIGTCSSLFIASPVAYAITKALNSRKERKQKTSK